jgi:hypothetical protein
VIGISGLGHMAVGWQFQRCRGVCFHHITKWCRWCKGAKEVVWWIRLQIKTMVWQNGFYDFDRFLMLVKCLIIFLRKTLWLFHTGWSAD